MLDLAPGGRGYRVGHGQGWPLIGRVYEGLRLYEQAGILPLPRRTDAGSRVYDVDAQKLLALAGC
jgi:hypothetical protein